MSTQVRQAIKDEVALVQRFTQCYRAKFTELIERMNHPLAGGRPDLQSLRFCMEAVDMMLSSQAEFAKAMNQIADCPSPTAH